MDGAASLRLAAAPPAETGERDGDADLRAQRVTPTYGRNESDTR
jgi:hypothetical protein